MIVWLFDIDGTLIASRGAGQAATYAALEERYGHAPATGTIAFAGRTDRAIAADLFRWLGIANNLDNWLRFRESYLRHLQDRLPQMQGQVLAGVWPLLESLRQQPQHQLGLLTGNIAAGAEAKLLHYGLWDFFAFGGYGDDHESRDDVARVARAAAVEHLRRDLDAGQIERVIVVGDTVHDIRCARAIHAEVIAVATGGTDRETLAAESPDLLLDDLAQVRSTPYWAGDWPRDPIGGAGR